MDARPFNLTRADLGTFLTTPKTVDAFENLNLNNQTIIETITGIQGASILTLGLSDSLNADRRLINGADITFSDGGPKGNVSPSLTATGVSPSTYGSAAQFVGLAIDAKGRITLAAQYAAITSNIAEGSNLYFTAQRARTATFNVAVNYVPKSTGNTSALTASPVYIDGGDRVLIGATTVTSSNRQNEFLTAIVGQWPLALTGNDRGLIVRNSSATSGIYAFFEYNGGTNNGSISYSGATTSYNTSSDERLKKNIRPAKDSGPVIDAIKVRQYDWRCDDVHVRYGLVAQELEEAFPEAVYVPTDDSPRAVDPSKLVALLILEVQALRKRVAALE